MKTRERKETEGGKTKIKAESKMAWLFVDDPQVHTNFWNTDEGADDRQISEGTDPLLRALFICSFHSFKKGKRKMLLVFMLVSVTILASESN